MAEYAFGEVTRLLYETIWNEYCDWGIELAKLRLADPRLSPDVREQTWWTLVDALDTYLRLLRLRTAVRTDAFRVPRRPGPLGRLLGVVRLVAWRMLRYQHDRMFFKQNTVNALLAEAVRELAEEHRRMRGEIDERRRDARGDEA